MRYKYFYNPQPSICPICGYKYFLNTTFTESRYGLQDIDNKLFFCCRENEANLLNAKICFNCGQPVYFRKCEIDDSDYFYIYIDAFLGWQGSAPSICIAVNQKNGETLCTAFKGDKYKDVELNMIFKFWLRTHIQSLLHYSSTENENIWYDVDVYNFKMFTNREANKFSFQSPYLNKHSLFKKLVNLILKVNTEFR